MGLESAGNKTGLLLHPAACRLQALTGPFLHPAPALSVPTLLERLYWRMPECAVLFMAFRDAGVTAGLTPVALRKVSLRSGRGCCIKAPHGPCITQTVNIIERLDELSLLKDLICPLGLYHQSSEAHG